MNSNRDNAHHDSMAFGGNRDDLDVFDASELHQLARDEKEFADTKESIYALETLFERVRIPDEMASSLAADQLADGAAAAPTTRLDIPEFEEKSILGVGGFGTVFLARDTRLERDVAVKVPRADRWAGSDDRQRFLEEARLAAKLQHPGIVTLLELVEHDERYHLVSELVEGETLQDLLDRGDITWQESAKIAQTLAEAMAHAHDNHVIHRDLKPTNILLDLEGNPKIADFGLAVRGEADSSQHAMAAGTLEYMSPEQLPESDATIDHRTDIWSFGVVLYEMLTGELPFQGESRRELFDAIENETPVPPRSKDNRIPNELQQICLRCLRQSRSDRFESAHEIANQLKRINNRAKLTPLVLLHRTLVAGVVLAISGIAASLMWPDASGIAEPKIAAAMRINHLRFTPDGLQGEEFGAIGERSTEVLEQDSINISITFSDPAYFRLIELTSSGEVQTHYVSDPDSAPVKEAEFPVERDADITLRDGPGSCIFAVICSRQPLEPLNAKRLASIEWSSGRHDGVWQYNNGRLFQMMPPDRSAVTPRVAAPALVSQACDQLGGDNVGVCAIAFPIEPVSRKDPK